MPKDNATFHLFRPSGKWGYSGRGYLSPAVFEVFSHAAQREQLLADNNREMPGISGPGVGYNVIVIGDEDLPYGYPLHLNAQ